MKRSIDFKYAIFLILIGHGGSTLIGYLMTGTKWLAVDILVFAVSLVTFAFVYFFTGEKIEETE